MMDENKFPTRRFIRCASCGQVFVSGVGERDECPECSSTDVRDLDAPESANGAGESKPAGGR
jgi:hypothetical protein